MKEYGIHWIEQNEKVIAKANDAIWGYAETGLLEYQSSEYLKQVLSEHGFQIEDRLADMDTAFMAVWSGKGPVIGFLAEYDALPGLSQKASDQKEPLRQGGAGHGCGHNTFAAAVLGGVLGLKYEMEQSKIPGTIVFFGCPAEELLIGKVKMARAQVFNLCDALLTCHPNDVGYVWARTSNAMQSLKFNFHGVTAHAAIDPFNGRSALDAVELMNMGANYLREHMKPEDRIHYVITDGGLAPNIVPDQAQVWYNIRSGSNESVMELARRVKRLADGAALMTETDFDMDVVSACSSVLRNRPLEELFLMCMKETGAPQWTEAETEFAEKIFTNIPEENVKHALKEYGMKKSHICHGLITENCQQLYQEGTTMTVSTDVGDASWNVPTGTFSFPSTVVGSPGHSWLYTSCCGSSIAHKGAVMAAKVFVRAGVKLMTDRELLKNVQLAFEDEKDGQIYKCPLDFCRQL